MSDFIEQLRLAEKAAEDIYCARKDRELIEALHRRQQAGNGSLPGAEQTGTAAGETGQPFARSKTE